MDQHDEKQTRREDELPKEEEFGPEAFLDSEEEAASPADAVKEEKEAPARVKQAKLPWILFAASVVALAVLLFTGKSGLSDAAAKVNGEKISKDQLYEALYKQGGDATLDNLIQDTLIRQEADKKKVKVTDQDIDAEIKEIKTRFPDEAQFEEALKQNNLNLDQLKVQIRNNLLVNKLFEGQMDLSDEKLKDYFTKNQSRYDTPEQVEVSHILVEKKEDAEKILADLKGGADFAAVAKEKSTDPGSKDKGGSLGFVSRGQGLDKAFEDAAFKLDKGQLSDIVQSSFGYHIIKVTDKKTAAKAEFEQSKDKVKKDLVQQEVGTKGAEWMDNLKKNAKIDKPTKA